MTSMASGWRDRTVMRVGAAILPGAVALADAGRRADQRLHVDPFVGHGGDRLVLAMREIEFLDALGGVAEAAAHHDVVVEVLVLVAHAADIERDLRLQLGQRRLHVVLDLDMHRRGDGEVLHGLAVAGAAEAFLQPRPVLGHGARHEAHGQPAVGDLGGELDRRFVAGGEIDRDVGVHVQDRLQRLADPQRARPGVGQRVLLAVMRHRPLAPEDLAHDRHVILHPVVGLAPRLAVPAFDDLRTRHAEAGDEPPAAGHRIDRRGRHRRIGRRARGKLHDAGAEFDALGQRREVGERRDGIRAIGLGGPHRIVAQLLGALHQLDRDVEMRA